MKKIIVVDEKDNVLGTREREKITSEDIYRVTALWIINKKGDILLAKRALDKKKDPGMWGPAVAGTVDEGETYESNIIKETNEEIGLKNIKIKVGPKTRIRVPHNHFTQWFILVSDFDMKDIKINEEVAEIKWFKEEEFLRLVKEKPSKFVSSMADFILLYYD